MRIGVIHWAFPPVIGGVEMHLLTICPEMVNQGAEVFVLTGSYEDAPSQEVTQGVHIIRREEMVPSNIEGWERRGRDLYPIAKSLFDEFLDGYRIEVVQAHNLHYNFFEYSTALTDACHRRRIPCYLVLHNDHFEDPETEAITQLIVGEIPWTRLVAISDYVKGSLAQLHQEVPQERWMVIPHGIDLEAFHPVEMEEKERLKEEYGFKGRKVILHPGRIIPWKGIIPALKGMPAIAQEFPEALLVLTGRAKVIFQGDQVVRYNRGVDKLIRELHLEENVHIGNYTHKDMPPLTALADILIYTSVFEEPFGLCPVEGMACEVPVIVTRSGGMAESVIDGETGFIISKDEERIPDELAEKIILLLSDARLGEKMGKAGRMRAERFFNKERMAQEFIKLSKNLIEYT